MSIAITGWFIDHYRARQRAAGTQERAVYLVGAVLVAQGNRRGVA